MMTRKEDMSRAMCCVLDKVRSKMNERFKQLMHFNDNFSFLLDTKSLLASRNDRNQFKKICRPILLRGCISKCTAASTY